MGSNDPGSDSEDQEGGKDRGEECPISFEELETRNRERRPTIIVVEADEDADVTIQTDGGFDVYNIIAEKVELLNQLMRKLIILAVLILIIVIVWRSALLVRMMESTLL